VRTIDVFADVACPFAHVGLRRFVAVRAERGLTEPVLRVRAWPLELVNEKAHEGASLAPKIAALREQVAPGQFRSFDPSSFPGTSLPAMAAEAAAYRAGPEAGEAFSLSVRAALFEDGEDISQAAVLLALARRLSVPSPGVEDEAAVQRDYREGQQRGVDGSPHFFTSDGSDFFCPSMAIDHDGDDLDVRFDVDGLAEFLDAAFG
jgi:predicted DsbA family dithiol-disulfide isomerase